MAVLEEIGGLLGSLVWSTLRSVRAWVDTPVEDRPEMFPEDAARRRMAEVLEASPPGNIEGALTDLAQLLDQPVDVDPAAVGVACTRIARWADDRAHPQTAAQFHQVAANACLTNAEYALAAARAARDLADYSRAEVWLQRAIGLARQSADWSMYGEAFLAFGTMMRRRGNLPLARRYIDRAMRRAIRQSDKHLKAKAAHDRFVLEAEAGQTTVAEEHARIALFAYAPSSPMLRMLAHDLAYLWLKRERPGEALAVFNAILPSCEPSERPYVLGGIALASGAQGDAEAYRAARGELRDLHPAPGVAEAWAEVAEAALQLDLPDQAESAAQVARRIAADRREHRIEFLVDAISERIKAARAIRRPARVAAATPVSTLPAGSLAHEVVAALQPV